MATDVLRAHHNFARRLSQRSNLGVGVPLRLELLDLVAHHADAKRFLLPQKVGGVLTQTILHSLRLALR